MTWEEGRQGDEEEEEVDEEEAERERREMEEQEEREGRPDNLTLGAEGFRMNIFQSFHRRFSLECLSKFSLRISVQPGSSCQVRRMWRNFC